jgi:hypothetical protein
MGGRLQSGPGVAFSAPKCLVFLRVYAASGEPSKSGTMCGFVM